MYLGGNRRWVSLLSILDSFRAGTKPYGIGLLFTHKNGDFRRDFCNGARLCRADLESEASHIGYVLILYL